MLTPALSAEWTPNMSFAYARTAPTMPKTDQAVDIRSQSLAFGAEKLFSTVSAAKRLSTALRSWKLIRGWAATSDSMKDQSRYYYNGESSCQIVSKTYFNALYDELTVVFKVGARKSYVVMLYASLKCCQEPAVVYGREAVKGFTPQSK